MSLPAFKTSAMPRAPHIIPLGATAFLADHRGTLFHEGERTLIVADLHLEKGSSFAERRSLLPPYDTAATLAKLAALIAHYAPRRVVALGDSFHDRRAGTRIAESDVATLKTLQKGRDWVWIAGNHDPDPPVGLGGEACDMLHIGAVTLRHEPTAGALAEIAGHLHPAARVAGASGSVRRRCFVASQRRIILPAFGAFTGGLNLRDAAFAPFLAGEEWSAHVMGRDRIYAVRASRCLGD